MNIGIRLHDTAPGTLRERLLFAKTQGFSCAHLALSKVVDGFEMQHAPDILNEDFANLVRGDFEAAGMSCAVLGCYLNIADPDEERWRQTQEIYRAHLQFAALTDAGVVGTETPVCQWSGHESLTPDSEEAYQLLISRLRTLVRFAEEANALLAVEPVWQHIISTPQKAERMLCDLHSDHLQIILDSVNLISPSQAGQEAHIIKEASCRLGDRIRVLHMKDYTVKDGMICSMACGLGNMQYEDLLTFAKARNLPMTLEDTTPETAEAARLHLEKIGKTISK